MRRTLANALASRIPTSLNIVSTDARVISYINSAQEILINKGHWIGLTQRYSVSVTNQLFTLPPQFATIESVAVCQSPITLRSLWYEFAQMGWGVRSDTDTCGSQALFRGNYCTYQDIVPGSKKVRLWCDLASDVGKTVVVIGLDDNGNVIRSSQGGVWADGEVVTLAQSPGTLTTNNFSVLRDIQLPVRNGQVWCYQWDGAVNTLLANYQSFETNPSYRRYLLPVIPSTATQIDVIGKMAFIPVINPTDYLLISNLEALRLGCLSVKRVEENYFAEADRFLAAAVALLQDELNHYEGSGYVPTISVINSLGDDPVPCLL